MTTGTDCHVGIVELGSMGMGAGRRRGSKPSWRLRIKTILLVRERNVPELATMMGRAPRNSIANVKNQ